MIRFDDVFPSDRSCRESRGALEVLEAASFVHLVSADPSGFQATSLPVIFDPGSGCLVGHLDRGNCHWQVLDNASVVVIAEPSESCVSPGWYPSKQENGGRVVPTWNYEAAHVHGVAQLRHEPAWLAVLVDRRTEKHESERSDSSDSWTVSDAPDEFIAQRSGPLLVSRSRLTEIEAKQKLGANRSDRDQGAFTRMTDLMSRALAAEPER